VPCAGPTTSRALIHSAPPPGARCAYRIVIVGDSDAIEDVRWAIKRVADLDVPGLIRGETGSGKEMVAGALVREGRALEGSIRGGQHGGDSSDDRSGRALRPRARRLHRRGAGMGYFGEAAGGT
jgi:two-component system nitrogen regulation response regulator GlnG